MSAEPNEFWPAIFGYSLKITDSFIALFTFGLLVATFFLWRSAEKTSKRQLRAYLSAKVEDLIVLKDGIARAKITIVNHGQIPAHDVTANGVVDLCPYPLPLHYSIPVFPRNLQKSKHPIHPKEECSSHITSSRIFSLTDRTTPVTDSDMRFYVFGLIQYKNGFDKECSTKYCVSAVVEKNGSISTYEIADRYNEAT